MSELFLAAAAVAAGGFLGGIARWALMHLNRLSGGRHPGTLAANVIGSAVLGVSLALPSLLPLAAGTGFAGALSTWSTLARELGSQIKNGRGRAAAVYGLCTAAASVAAAWAGIIAGGALFS